MVPDSRTNEKRHSLKLELVVLLFIWLLFSTINLIWLWKDQRPLAWDQSHHFLLGLKYLEAFSNPSHWDKILSLEIKYPPLFHLSLALLFWFIGPTIRFAATINLFWLLATMIPVWLLGRKIFGPWVGIIAATILILSPIGAGLSRELLMEICLTSVVVWTVWLLLQSQGLSQRKPVVLLGVLFGFGLLAKWTYLLLIAGPFLWAFIQTDPQKNRIDWKGLTWALILCLVIALPWYLHSPRTLVKILFQNAWAYGAEHGYPRVFSSAGLLTYPRMMINDQLFLVTFLFVLLGIFWNFIKNRYQSAPLLVWLFAGLFIFTLLQTKDTRFIFPLLPAALLLGVGGISSLTSSWQRNLSRALILLFSLFAFWGTSFQIPILSQEIDLRLGPATFRLSGPSAGYVRPPDPSDWSVPLILKTILQDRSQPSSTIRLDVLVDLVSFHGGAFKAWIRAHHLPMTIKSLVETLESSSERGKESLYREIAQLDYLLTKTGDLGSEIFYKTQKLLDLDFLERKEWIIPIARFSLPDGTQATLWRINIQGKETGEVSASPKHASNKLLN